MIFFEKGVLVRYKRREASVGSYVLLGDGPLCRANSLHTGACLRPPAPESRAQRKPQAPSLQAMATQDSRPTDLSKLYPADPNWLDVSRSMTPKDAILLSLDINPTAIAELEELARSQLDVDPNTPTEDYKHRLTQLGVVQGDYEKRMDLIRRALSRHGAALSGTVVRTSLPRRAPCRPMARIRRSTEQRAPATWPPRCQSHKLGSCSPRHWSQGWWRSEGAHFKALGALPLSGV